MINNLASEVCSWCACLLWLLVFWQQRDHTAEAGKSKTYTRTKVEQEQRRVGNQWESQMVLGEWAWWGAVVVRVVVVVVGSLLYQPSCNPRRMKGQRRCDRTGQDKRV